ncbi:MAG: hypothetical protein KC609_09955 [Myxococcales bacterium]|nr:hypothetical protein [Myxococcales bacterium]
MIEAKNSAPSRAWGWGACLALLTVVASGSFALGCRKSAAQRQHDHVGHAKFRRDRTTTRSPTRTTPTTRSEKPTAPSTRPTMPALSRGLAPLPRGVQRGICYAHNWQGGGVRGYGSAASLASKRELWALGVRWISLTPFGWQPSLTSREVHLAPSHRAGENDRRIEREIRQARQLGLKVQLKPHIWVRRGAWRGAIQPAGVDGWQSWFASYRRFILHYARLAERLKVDAFVVGVEFKSSSRSQRVEWEKTIAAVRAVYRGPLTYAANWDEVATIEFWDKLDWIGVQFFPPLTTKLEPSDAELLAAVKRHLARYRRVSKRFGKPLLFTEVGYKSVHGTAIRPWDWPENLADSMRRYDARAQAQAFRAFFLGLRDVEKLAGVFVWKWFSDVDTDEEGRLGFSPRGKIASQVIRAVFDGR